MKSKEKQNFPEQKLLNGEILERFNALNRVGELYGFDVCYPLERNKEKLRIAIKANKLSQELAIPKKQNYKDYELAMQEMFKSLTLKEDGSHAIRVEKDWDGSEKEVYDVDTKGEEYLKEKALLNLKHKAALDEREQQFVEYSEFLEQPFKGDLKLHYIPYEVFRETNPKVSSRVLSLISWMILEKE